MMNKAGMDVLRDLQERGIADKWDKWSGRGRHTLWSRVVVNGRVLESNEEKVMANTNYGPIPVDPEKRPGMTLREYYAGLALQGILARRFDDPGENLLGCVQDAVEYADALIKELKKTENG